MPTASQDNQRNSPRLLLLGEKKGYLHCQLHGMGVKGSDEMSLTCTPPDTKVDEKGARQTLSEGTQKDREKRRKN